MHVRARCGIYMSPMRTLNILVTQYGCHEGHSTTNHLEYFPPCVVSLPRCSMLLRPFVDADVPGSGFRVLIARMEKSMGMDLNCDFWISYWPQ